MEGGGYLDNACFMIPKSINIIPFRLIVFRKWDILLGEERCDLYAYYGRADSREFTDSYR